MIKIIQRENMKCLTIDEMTASRVAAAAAIRAMRMPQRED